MITGAQLKAGTGLKMQMVRFFNVTLLGIYRWLKIYRWLVTFGSARWLLEILSASCRSMEDSQEKDYSFLGNDTSFLNLYDALV